MVTALGEDIRFPADSGVVDVTKAPYHAKGDGKHDDTEAIQQALIDHPDQNRIIYLPNGVYRVSAPLRWPSSRGSQGSQRATILQGQSRAGTVIRVEDQAPAFSGPTRDNAVLWMGTAPAWHDRNAVRNLTVHTGNGNPSVTGIHFIGNRQGGLRDVTVIAGSGGAGYAGVDASHCDSIGPALFKNVRVEGFDYGIKAGYPQYSLTLEHVELVGQRAAGLRNMGQTMSIRDLRSTNGVPAIQNNDLAGFVTLLDSSLTGTATRRPQSALANRGFLFVRAMSSAGYTNAIESRTTTNRVVPGPEVGQFLSHPRVALFEGAAEAMELPVEETPEVAWGPMSEWASPLAYGGRPDDDGDDSAAIQAAIDSGATTVYLPNGSWRVRTPVLVRGAVRRVIGCEARIVNANLGDKAAFRLVEGSAPVVVIERLSASSPYEGLIEHASTRTLVISSCSDVRYVGAGPGKLFIEDVSSVTPWVIQKQTVWARQWTVERDGPKVVNRGGTVWILGLTAQRPGTVVTTTEEGKTALFGALVVASGGAKQDPMFVIREASASLVASEIALMGMPYGVVVSETRGGVARVIELGVPGMTEVIATHTGGVGIPLYSGYRGTVPVPPPAIPSRTNRPALRVPR